MLVEKGTLMRIDHKRKGRFVAVAYADFDTDMDQWYSVVLAPGEMVLGLAGVFKTNMAWINGEKIPCRASLVTCLTVMDSK